jgi:hypothetical protein
MCTPVEVGVTRRTSPVDMRRAEAPWLIRTQWWFSLPWLYCSSALQRVAVYIAGVIQGHAATQRLHCVVASPSSKIAIARSPDSPTSCPKGSSKDETRYSEYAHVFPVVYLHILTRFNTGQLPPISLLGVYATPAD